MQITSYKKLNLNCIMHNFKLIEKETTHSESFQLLDKLEIG
jgi:hypothetical protein